MVRLTSLQMIKNVHPTGFRETQWKGYYNNAYYNGLGRFVPQLVRLTIKFCKEYQSSLGVREFIETEMVDFARKNPGTAFYLKPRRHRSPVIVAEYMNGQTDWHSIYKMGKKDIAFWLEWFTTKSGNPIMFFEKNYKSEFPSIQGVWHPFMFKPQRWSLGKFPDLEASEYKTDRPSATEQLLRIAKAEGLEVPNIIRCPDTEEENEGFEQSHIHEGESK